MSPIEGRHFTTSDYNKFTVEILDTKLKEKTLAKSIDLNILSELVNNNKEKIKKLKTLDLSFFLVKFFFADDGMQKCVYLSLNI